MIDYSFPNIVNMLSCNIWKNITMKKVVHVPPMPYEYAPKLRKRTLEFTTTIIQIHGRRAEILQELTNINGMNITNFSESFNLSEQSFNYSQTKILLNLHQTDYHHNLEEFRILPALLRGTVIVSKDIPLKKIIPYHEYIIWSKKKKIYFLL